MVKQRRNQANGFIKLIQTRRRNPHSNRPPLEGGIIKQQNNIYHGYQSKVKVNNKSKIFQKNKIFKIGRYHSLKLHEPFKSNNIDITMRCTKSNIPMAFEDNLNKIYGFQFHPDSFLTENGKFFIKKILSY